LSSDPIKLAHSLIAQGQAKAAVEALVAAGSAEAWAELATIYLAGEHVRRDLAIARLYLRRAVHIGHVDAALTEIALTANGSGSPANWAEAISLLRIAAQTDPIASQQLQVLALMDLDSEGRPVSLPPAKQLSTKPLIKAWGSFLTPYECGLIAQTAQGSLEPSLVADPRTGKLISHPIRTSSAALIGPTRESLPIQAILKRIAAVTDTDVRQGESLTVLHYAPGQQYRMHMDALPNTANQRVATMILYLNEGYNGGETQFEANGVTFTPKAGDALFFENTAPNGQPDPASRHAGLPVTAGAKWVATRWIRARSFDVWQGPEEIA
jgi:prolyl 4-hydroxylase